MKMLKDGIKTLKNKEYKSLNASYKERLKWYLTPEWRELRANFLQNNPYCVKCGEKATVCDHKDGHDPLTWKDTFFTGAFQALCFSCHSRKTVLEDMKKKVKRLTQAEKLTLLGKL